MIHTEKEGYELRYDFNAYCDYEARFGHTLPEGIRKARFEASMNEIRGLVWAGLLYKGAITLKEAGEKVEAAIMDGMSIADLELEIIKAVNEANFITRLSKTAAEQKARETEKTEKQQESISMS